MAVSEQRNHRIAQAALAKSNTVTINVNSIYEADRQKFKTLAQDLNVSFDANNNVSDNGIKLDVAANTAHANITTGNPHNVTLADLGYTGAPDANKYVHPTYDGDDFSVDTGTLTGATVVSDIDINVTTDDTGHVTDANASVATRTLTLADLGLTGFTGSFAIITGVDFVGQTTTTATVTVSNGVITSVV